MTDRKNVIKALEHCKDNQYVNDCNECDYGGKTGMFCIRMIDDAIVLLKEQEAKTGHWIDTTKVFGFPRVQCSVCGSEQGAVWMYYCPICGAKMSPLALPASGG